MISDEVLSTNENTNAHHNIFQARLFSQKWDFRAQYFLTIVKSKLSFKQIKKLDTNYVLASNQN